jgi:hypothetical protein
MYLFLALKVGDLCPIPLTSNGGLYDMMVEGSADEAADRPEVKD